MPDEVKLTPGQRVLYLAPHDHWHETDVGGKALFDFVYETDGPIRPGGHRAWAKGDLVADEDLKHIRGGVDGKLHMGGPDGPAVTVLRQKQLWPGVVREDVEWTSRETTAVVDGEEQPVWVRVATKRLVIDVAHPCGFITLHLPLDGPNPVHHDPAGRQRHSYRLSEEARP